MYQRSRQAYYKRIKQLRHQQDTHKVLQGMIDPIRAQLPRVGGKKLYFMIQSDLHKYGIKIGRDRFFDYLRSTDQLVRPRRRYVVTTQSSHRFRVYKNLFQDRSITQKHQAWVSDITYLRTQDGFCYLSLITDAWSHKIVGYHLSNNMELEGCLQALRMALRQLPTKHSLIHHSDRGIQYCSNTYTRLLKQKGVKISMAEKGNCYQNSMAERVNGILKNEFYLDQMFINLEHARSASKQAISSYNKIRPHWSLELKTPEKMHSFTN